ncbi:acidic mammalian chitinase-like [Mastacembelus armatus]|uniref:acidic mammalian chitinase-like n=1 Tax=Mastacembelus armatus TaxID=205130 RepID=UPI000E455C0E|nr:acidic mammalian chitinase-like [Mastacembelus armatus]
MYKLRLIAGICLIIASLGTCTTTRNFLRPTTPTTTPSTTTRTPTTTTTTSTRTTTSSRSDTGSGGPCAGRSDGLYTNPNDPNSFYNCGNGITHIQNCQPGLVFRQSCNCCDYSTGTTSTSSGTASGGACAGKSDGLYTNPNNPNSFYNCANGITHIQNCQPGLVFRQSCNCCDYSTGTT